MSVRTVLCCQNMFMLNLKWLNICSALEFPNFSGSDSVIDDWSNWCSTDIDSYLPTTVTNVFCSAVDITERANFAWRASSFMNYISDFTIVNYEFCSWYNWKSKLSLCTMFFFLLLSRLLQFGIWTHGLDINMLFHLPLWILFQQIFILTGYAGTWWQECKHGVI